MGINQELEAAREAGEPSLAKLEAAYVSALRAAGREASERFSAQVTMVAAATGWVPPDVTDVMAFAIRGDRIRAQQRNMLAAVGGRVSEIPGVSFDLLMPPAQRMLDSLAKRLPAAQQGLRQPVGDAIARGWAEGKSVPDVARDIRTAVNGLAPARAVALARTDLIALSNGAGHEAVGQLNGAAREAGQEPPVRSKTWTSAGDARVRPTHQDADGQTVPIDQPFIVGGTELLYPGDPNGPDDEVIQCRCVELFNEEGAGMESESDPEVPATIEQQIDMSGLSTVFFGAEGAAIRAEVDEVLAQFGKMPAPKSMTDKLRGKALNTGVYGQPDAHGSLKFMTSPRTGETIPLSLQVARLGPHRGNTFLHEYGHFIDLTALGSKGFASIEGGKGIEKLLRVIDDSPEMRDLADRRARYQARVDEGTTVAGVPLSASDVKLVEEAIEYIDYLLDNREMFARAFAQWGSTRHGGPKLRAELDGILLEEKSPNRYFTQWAHRNFAPIADAIDEFLRENGLLPAVVAAALLEIDVGSIPGAEVGKPLLRLLRGQVLVLGDERHQLLLAGAVENGLGDVHGHSSHGNAARSRHIPDVHSEESTGGHMSVVEQAVGVRWISDIAFEGLSTGDGRFMVPGSLGWRDLPLTLMSMIETPEFGGHAGAQVAGRMDTMSKDSDTDMDGEALPEGVTAVRSTGEFDLEGDRGEETARMVEDETMRGISIDLAVHEWAFRDPETGELIDPEEATDEQWERAFMGELEFAVVDGEIMAATVCPTPAFADARIAILASAFVRPKVWLASKEGALALGVPEGQLMTTLVATAYVRPHKNTGVSFMAAALKVSLAAEPSLASFQVPETNGPCPLTIDDNGRVYGHIALWDTCHTGFVNQTYSQCVRAPRSATGYAYFHTGELVTQEGERIAVGRLTFDTSHAPINLGRAATRKHYDETGSVGAYVRAKDGQYGIWVCGELEPSLSADGLRACRANPPSGDWRSVDHNLELIAALHVPVAGLPIPRSQLAMQASAAGDIEVTALILSGMVASAVEVENDDTEATLLALEIEHGPDIWSLMIEGDFSPLHAA